MAGLYDPNEQDQIIGDAMAVGGPAFVEQLHYAAMEAAEAVVPWDGNGEEPAAYRAIWVAFARKMVAERRSTLGMAGAPDESPNNATDCLSDHPPDAPRSPPGPTSP